MTPRILATSKIITTNFGKGLPVIRDQLETTMTKKKSGIPNQSKNVGRGSMLIEPETVDELFCVDVEKFK
jgi:hypothetical protein